MNSFLKRVRNLARTIQSSSLEHQRAEAELRSAVEESLALLTPVDRIRIRSTLRYSRQKDRNMHALQRRLQEERRLEARSRCERARLKRELRSLQAQRRRNRAMMLRLHDEESRADERMEALRGRLRAYPASQEDIEQLPSVAITSEHKGFHCSICVDDFREEENVLKLPCDHLFHKKCIVPWSELHNSCPVCRRLISEPSDDTIDGN